MLQILSEDGGRAQPKTAVIARMCVSGVTVDFLHLDDARGERYYDLQVSYTI
jgi:hypothetical protein